MYYWQGNKKEHLLTAAKTLLKTCRLSTAVLHPESPHFTDINNWHRQAGANCSKTQVVAGYLLPDGLLGFSSAFGGPNGTSGDAARQHITAFLRLCRQPLEPQEGPWEPRQAVVNYESLWWWKLRIIVVTHWLDWVGAKTTVFHVLLHGESKKTTGQMDFLLVQCAVIVCMRLLLRQARERKVCFFWLKKTLNNILRHYWLYFSPPL